MTVLDPGASVPVRTDKLRSRRNGRSSGPGINPALFHSEAITVDTATFNATVAAIFATAPAIREQQPPSLRDAFFEIAKKVRWTKTVVERLTEFCRYLGDHLAILTTQLDQLDLTQALVVVSLVDGRVLGFWHQLVLPFAHMTVTTRTGILIRRRNHRVSTREIRISVSRLCAI